MKNLTKYLLLLLIPLGTILFFVFFVEKVAAQQNGTCSKVINRNVSSWKCSLLGFEKEIFVSQDSCNSECITPPTPTPTPTPTTATPTPTSTPISRTATATPTKTLTPTPIPAPKFVWRLISSCNVQTATPTPTPTLTPATSQLSPEECSSRCGARTDCAKCPNGNFICGTTDVSQCSDFVPTSTLTPKPNSFSCVNQTGPFAGNYQCRPIVNGSVQCESGFGSFSPDFYTGTSCSTNQGCCKQGTTQNINLFACTDQETGGFAGTYTCAPFVNNFSQCPSGFSEFTPNSTFTGTSCNSNQRCCKKDPVLPTAAPTPTTIPGTICPVNNLDAVYSCSVANPGFSSCARVYLPGQTANCLSTEGCWRCPLAPTATGTPTPTPIPTPTPTPVPTPLPGSVQLALSVAQQGLTSTPLNINRQATVILKGTDGQTTTKTGTVTYSGGTFNGTINLGILPNGTYKTKVKVGNFLKSFTTDLVISGTAANAQTKVIAGLDDQDDVDAILFYNGLRACFGSNIGVKKCDNPQDIDLTGDGNVDIIDYQTYLKGIRNLLQGLPVL